MPKRAKEGGGGGGNKKRSRLDLPDMARLLLKRGNGINTRALMY
jgi:hypothetical protein